ncbi:MAG: hypothetical protein ACRDGU_01005 [Actinomycetota bacterium]
MTSRGIRPVLLLAIICVLAGGCARTQSPGVRRSSAPPDAATAIALSVLSDSIHLVDPNSGRRTTLKEGLPHFQAGHAAWSPDRWLLAYGNNGIFLLDPRTGREWSVAKGENLSMPAWSADGSSIVFGDGTSLWVAGVDGSEPTRIRLRATLAALGMAWHPGGVIAFQGLRRDCKRDYRCPATDQSEIWTIHADGSHLRRLTDVGHAESPKWSPDGSRLLFIRRLFADGRRELWSVNADGSGASRLLDAGDVVAADWSPDGARLAVVRSGPEPRTLQVWVADGDASNARPLGTPIPGFEATIDW